MPKGSYDGPLEKIDDCVWRIPKGYKPGMNVEGRIFADDRLMDQIRADQAPEQVANVAHLPGIQSASLAMPDIHWGYGFCIGGVCATDPEEDGVISPGGVGYDINCGVRLVRTNLMQEDVEGKVEGLTNHLFGRIPAGVGKSGPYSFRGKEMKGLLRGGSKFLKTKGLATAVRKHAEDWSRQNEIEIQVNIQNERPVPLNVEQMIFRIIQEALANVARHSQASRVEVGLTYNKLEITCTISDDGLGFNPKEKKGGFGIRSMQERANALGSNLTLKSAPGDGTRISFTVTTEQAGKTEENISHE